MYNRKINKIIAKRGNNLINNWAMFIIEIRKISTFTILKTTTIPKIEINVEPIAFLSK